MTKNKIYALTDEQFVEMLKNSATISEVLFKLGYTIKGNSWGYSQIKQRMTDLNLDFSVFKGKKNIYNNTIKQSLTTDMLLKENCKHSRTILKKQKKKKNFQHQKKKKKIPLQATCRYLQGSISSPGCMVHPPHRPRQPPLWRG